MDRTFAELIDFLTLLATLPNRAVVLTVAAFLIVSILFVLEFFCAADRCSHKKRLKGVGSATDPIRRSPGASEAAWSSAGNRSNYRNASWAC